VPSRDEAHAYPYTEYDREEIAHNRQRLAVGAPGAVRERIESLAAAHEAEEAMILTITPDYASRARSYALLADAFALTPAYSEV
jgi:alkanesulfonate monooxygenase SsuD/methylene tetrahydromethanopterin reductase-like flavin-dependent oxidoreductase (luciferase family)